MPNPGNIYASWQRWKQAKTMATEQGLTQEGQYPVGQYRNDATTGFQADNRRFMQKLREDTPGWNNLGFTDKIITALGAGVPQWVSSGYDMLGVEQQKRQEHMESLQHAMERFSNSWAGKALYALDITAEGLERTIGLASQFMNGEVTDGDIKDYWAAGTFAYDVARLPQFNFKKDSEGSIVGASVTWDEDLPGASGLIWARKRIQQLTKEEGMTHKEAIAQTRAELYADLGSSNVTAAKQDFFGHWLLDPLNWFAGWLKPIDRMKMKSIKALYTKTDPELIRALQRLPTDELRQFTGIADDAAERAAFLAARQGTAWDDVTDLFSEARFTDTLREMAENNKLLTTADKICIFMTGGAENAMKYMGVEDIPLWARNWLQVVADSKVPIARRLAKAFTLTDDSKAWEVLIQVVDNTMAKMPKNTAKEAIDFLKGVHYGLVSPKYGHNVMTVQGRAVQMMVRKAIIEADDLYASFKHILQERRILNTLARAFTPDDPRRSMAEVLKTLAKEGPETVIQRLRQMGDEQVDAILRNIDRLPDLPVNRMNLDDLGFAIKAIQDDVVIANMRQIVQDDLPYNLDYFFVHLNNALTESLDEAVVSAFGIKDLGLVRKLSDAMKAGQSLAFLKVNPGFAMRNFLNNEMTMIGRGLSPFVSGNKIDELLDGLGYVPLKVNEAFTMAGDTFIYGPRQGLYQPGAKIQDALIGERKFLDNAREWIGNREVPDLLNFGELARKSEEWASKRAFYQGFQQGWKDMWKPGAGFTAPADHLSPELLRALGDDTVRQLSYMIGDITAADNFDDLFMRNPHYSPTALMDHVREQVGREWGMEMPQETYDFLHSNLERVIQESADLGEVGIIENWFDTIRRDLSNHMDILTRERQAARIDYAMGLTQGLGPTSAIPLLLGDTFDDLMHAHIAHSIRMANIGDLDIPFAAKQIKWRNVLAETEDYWRRHWTRFEDTVRGIKNAMDDLGMPFDRRLKRAVNDYRHHWDEFFEMRNSKYDDYFRRVAAGEEVEDFMELKNLIDGEYVRYMNEELDILQRVDSYMNVLMSDARFGDISLAPAFASWRAQMLDIKRAYRRRTKAFFDEIAEEPLTVAQRSRKFNDYFNQTSADWAEAAIRQRQGLIAMYGDLDGIERMANVIPDAHLVGVNRAIVDFYEESWDDLPEILADYILKEYDNPNISDATREWIRNWNLEWAPREQADDNAEIIRSLVENPDTADTLRKTAPSEVVQDAIEYRRRFQARQAIEEEVVNLDHIYNVGVVPDGWQTRVALPDGVSPRTINGQPDIDGKLYHVTTQKKGIAKSGLLSRDQLERLGIVGTGLQGGPGDAISTTYSFRKAQRLKRFFTDAIDVARGRKSFGQVLDLYDDLYNIKNMSVEDFFMRLRDAPSIESGVHEFFALNRVTQGAGLGRTAWMLSADEVDELLLAVRMAPSIEAQWEEFVRFSRRIFRDQWGRDPGKAEFMFFNQFDYHLNKLLPDGADSRIHQSYIQEPHLYWDVWRNYDPGEVTILNVATRPGLREAGSGEMGLADTYFHIRGEYELKFNEGDLWVIDDAMDLKGWDGELPTPRPGIWENIHQGGPMLDVGYDQAQVSRAGEMIDMLQAQAERAAQMPGTIFDDMLTPLQKAEMQDYLNMVQGQFNETKAAAVGYAGWRRDTALLNYRRRTKFDQVLGTMMPYSFWMTHSIWNWALHSIDRPSMLANYLRMRKMFKTSGLMQEGFPTRLSNSIRIPILDPPDWMGDNFYGDPARALFPFDQMMFPYEKYVESKREVVLETENRIRQAIRDRAVDETTANEALRTHKGELWDQYFAEVSSMWNHGNEAFDIANTFSSFHAPIQWGMKFLMDEEEDIGPLTPGARSVKQLYGAFGINPVADQQGFGTALWDVGSSIRQQLGLHPFDKWEDYRIDRAIVNLVATDPQITIDDALRAMINRSGPIYQAAASQAAKQYARADFTEGTTKEKFSSIVAFVMNQSGIPIYTYPEGEKHQRQLKDEFNQAMYDEYEKQIPGALNDFFKKYPEYEARLALWKSPEVRLKNFMVDQMWNEYYNMTTVHRRQLVDALGPEFEQKFINSATRNYDAISPEQLYRWLKALGADPPGSLPEAAAAIEFAPIDIAQQAQEFYNMRLQMFPNYFELQNEYFDLAEDSASRRNHPVKAYWAWREDYFHKHPEILPYVDDDYQLKYKSVAERDAAMGVQQQQITAQQIQATMSDSVFNFAMKAAQGEQIPADIREYLMRKAHSLGINYATMIRILQ